MFFDGNLIAIFSCVSLLVSCALFADHYRRINRALRETLVRHSEQARHVSENDARYQAILNSAPIGYLIWETGYRILEWSSHAEFLFGWTREEMADHSFLPMLVPKHAHDQFAYDAATLFSGAASRIKTTLPTLTRDGGIVECEWHHSVLCDTAGVPDRILSLCCPIDNMSQTQWNSGCSLELRKQAATQMESKKLLAFEPDNCIADDTAPPVDAINSLVTDDSRRCSVCFFRDMANRYEGRARRQQLEALAALHEQDKRYRGIHDHTTAAIFILNVTEGGLPVFDSVNPSAEKAFGIPAASLLGLSFGEIIDGRLAPDVGQSLLRYLHHFLAPTLTGMPVEFEANLHLVPQYEKESAIHHIKLIPIADDTGIARVIAIGHDITAQKQREAHLKEMARMESDLGSWAAFQNTLLNALRDAGMQMMMLESGRVIYISNRELAYRIGYTDAEIDAHPSFLDFVHPDDRARVGDNYRRRTAGEDAPTRYELGLITRAGERIEYEVSIAIVPDTTPLRVVAISQDITERKRMELELATRERDFRRLAENMPDNVARWDTECRYLYINPTQERLLGAPSADIVGTYLPDTHTAVRAAIKRVVASKEAIQTVRQQVTVNGVVELHDVTLVPEFDADGSSVVSVLGIGHDMTNSYRMQESIAAREQAFRSLAESTPDFIIRVDRQLLIRYLNGSLLQRMGLTNLDALVGLSHLDVWPDNRFGALEQAEADAILSGQSQSIELIIQNDDGIPTHHQMFVVPERDVNDEIIGTIAFGRDITALKQTKRNLEASQTQMQQLLAYREDAREDERQRIARDLHEELGQLLTALRMDISLLPIQHGRTLPVLFERSKIMIKLVDRTIKSMRGTVANLRPTALDAGLGAGIEWLAKDLFRHTGILCHTQLPNDEMELGDSLTVTIFRIVQESLTNAARHAEAKHITVKMEGEGAFWRIEISDDGKGFNPAAVSNGSFGLLGMRERAAVLGGSFAIDSVFGKGTTVIVRIPTRT